MRSPTTGQARRPRRPGGMAAYPQRGPVAAEEPRRRLASLTPGRRRWLGIRSGFVDRRAVRRPVGLFLRIERDHVGRTFPRRHLVRRYVTMGLLHDSRGVAIPIGFNDSLMIHHTPMLPAGPHCEYHSIGGLLHPLHPQQRPSSRKIIPKGCLEGAQRTYPQTRWKGRC